MYIRHPQTGKTINTNDGFKVRCDDCRRQNGGDAPLTDRIKLVRVGNKNKLVCTRYHAQFYERRSYENR